MEIRLPKRSFSEALAALERVIPTRSSNTVLTQLWMEAGPDGLLLRGSNGEIDLEITVPAEVDGEGARLVPGQLIGQVVRSLPGELVEMAFEGAELLLESGSFSTRLATGDPADYPQFNFAAGEFVRIPAAELARAIQRVRYAASNEDYRAIFRGVQIELHPEKLRTVASDGFRLALYDLARSLGQEKRFVVPARSADEVVKVLERADGEVSLAVEAGHLTLAAEGFRMAVALMEGEFPEYERVIPASFVFEARVSAPTLRDSLKRVKVLADRNNHRVDLVFSGGQLQVVAEGELGRGAERLEVEAPADAEMTLAYNAEYLLDALGPVAGTALLKFSGPASASVVQDAEDEGYLAVVVPLRV